MKKQGDQQNRSRYFREAGFAKGDHRDEKPESGKVDPLEAALKGIEANPELSQQRSAPRVGKGDYAGQPHPELKHIRPPKARE